MAFMTFFETRFGGPISAGAGWSRAASARLAGIGGVMFSMIGTIGACPAAATHRNVTPNGLSATLSGPLVRVV